MPSFLKQGRYLRKCLYTPIQKRKFLFWNAMVQVQISHRTKMKVAVEGCCHGQLDAIYQHIAQLEQRNGYKVDVLLICGDFQAIRNPLDLECMAVPNKYKQLGTFYKYYTGAKEAPVLTIVIGGNHEASNYMSELYYGGWLAPKIYYLGCAGSVLLNGIRISGASGIFKEHHFRNGYYERVPYNPNSVRSVYHIREFSVRKLSLLPSSNIFLSHDWPKSIEHHGNLKGLLQRKSFLREDIDQGSLGSPPLMGLLHTLRPEWWFSAHLHTRYEAVVVHDDDEFVDPSNSGHGVPTATATGSNPDEIMIDDDDDDKVATESIEGGHASSSTSNLNSRAATQLPSNPDEIKLGDEELLVDVPPSVLPRPPPLIPKMTKFLALDKCLPRRQFLEVVDVDPPKLHDKLDDSSNPQSTSSGGELGQGPPIRLSFDPEWLAITRALHPWFSTSTHQPPFPDEAEATKLVAKEREWVSANVKAKPKQGDFGDGDGEVAISDYQTFGITAPGGPGPTSGNERTKKPVWYRNPQTEAFCQMLGISNLIDSPYE